MKTLLKLSLRNIFRQRRRSLVTIAAGAVGVVGLLFYLSLMNGMIDAMIRSSLGYRLPPVSIEKIEKGDYQPFGIGQGEMESIQALAGVEGTSPRLIRDSLMVSADLSVISGARGVRLIGVDPKKESSVTDVASMLHGGDEGNWLSQDYDPGSPQVVIGEALAQKLKVRIGDMVILTVLQTTDEEDRMDGESGGDARSALTVTGIFHSGDTGFEKNHAFVHGDFLKVFLSKNKKDQIHQFAIKTDSMGAVAVARQVRELLKARVQTDSLLVRDWKEKDSFLASNISVFEVFNGILLLIVLSASSFVVVNTMLMVVQERFREFGILKAVGATGFRIAAMILIEGIFLAVGGVLAGMLLSLPVVGFLSYSGLYLGVFARALGEMGIGEVLYPFLKLQDILMTVILATIFAWIGTVIPAIRAARIRPLDAIHFK